MSELARIRAAYWRDATLSGEDIRTLLEMATNCAEQQTLRSEVANELRAATAENAKLRGVLRVAVEALTTVRDGIPVFGELRSTCDSVLQAIRAHLGEKQHG